MAPTVFGRPMRPETIARRAREAVAERERMHADLVARMTAAASDANPERAAFWRDGLHEHYATCDRCNPPKGY